MASGNGGGSGSSSSRGRSPRRTYDTSGVPF